MAPALTKRTFVSFKPTILYAEDSESDSLLIQLGLEDAKAPFSLQFVSDGLDAKDYLERQGPYADRGKYPDPCMLLTDLKMPRMDGFDLLSWVRSTSPWEHLPIIVVSGSDQPQDREKAFELGANDYVVKELILQPKCALFEAVYRHAPGSCDTATGQPPRKTAAR